MQYNKYNRKTLIQIIKKRADSDYRFLFDECFSLLQSIVANEQKKGNYDYDESFADFNDCINKAEWTEQVIKQAEEV
jgi:hypothetical protein